MFKKIFFLFLSIAALGIGMFGLTSCDTTDNLIEVKNFKTNKVSYSKDEEVIFDITISKKNSDIDIKSAEIETDYNKEKITIYLTSNDEYHFVGSTKYDGFTTRFKLTNINFDYIDNNKNLVAANKEVTNLQVKIGYGDNDNSSNIWLNSIQLKNPEGNASFYLDQEVTVILNLNNPYQRLITEFEFTLDTIFTDANGIEHKMTNILNKKSVDATGRTDYSFNLTLPEDTLGESTLYLSKVSFIDANLTQKEVKVNPTSETKCSFKIERRGVTYKGIALNSKDFTSYNLNGSILVESGTLLPLKITLLNEDLMIPTSVTINGTEYNVSSTEYTTNAISKITTITVDVVAPNAPSTLKKVNVSLDKVTLIKGDFTLNYKPKVGLVEPFSLYLANSVITSKEELTELFKKPTISGYNIVLSNIDMLNTSLNTSTLSGTLDFQGHFLSNWQSSKPMFDNISETGVLKNVIFNGPKIYTEPDESIKYSGLLATANNGLINNIKINSLSQIGSTSHTHIEGDGLIPTDLGLVKNNTSTGVITNIDMSFSVTVNKSANGLDHSYSPIVINNAGKIAYIYCVGTDLTYPTTLASGKINFYMLGKNNTGTITSVVFEFTAKAEKITGAYFHFKPQTSSAGVTTNILVTEVSIRSALSANPDQKFDENATGTIGVFTGVEGIIPAGMTSDEQLALYHSLGFNSSGSGFVWKYGESGVSRPTLIFK